MPRCGQIVWSACLGLVWRGTRSDSARFMKCGQDYWMREEVKEAVSGEVTCYICGVATAWPRLFSRAADNFTGMMIFLHVSCFWSFAWTEAITCQ
jgi:hypothetical protein